MALTIPTSMQRIVGDKFLRLGTSYDRTRFFIDIPKADPFGGRTRYGYQLTDGIITGSYNLSPLLGATVLSVTAVDDGATEGKIIFTSNPTGSKLESTILYVGYTSGTASFLLAEEGDYLIQQSGFRIILDDGGDIGDVGLSDAVLPKNVFQSVDSDTKFFVIQEDDF